MRPCLLLAVLLVAGCPATAPTPTCGCAPPSEALPSDSLLRLAGRWTDQDGRAVALADLEGRPRVVAMVFSRCPGACPRLVADLRAIEAALPSDRTDVGFVLASFDHARDDPARLRAWAAELRLDTASGRWTLLHGGAGEVRELAAALGVQYQRLADGAYGHSNVITVLNRRGQPAARLEGLGADPGALLAALKTCPH